MRAGLSHFALSALFAAVAARAGERERPFRRIVFEAVVPLGEEAPTVAAEGHLVAFGSGTEVHVVDVRTGRTLLKQSLAAGAAGRPLAAEARVLGIADGKVYACVRRFTDPDRLDPGGREARIGGGPEAGYFEVVAFALSDPEVEHVVSLPRTAMIAPRLLGPHVVYTEGHMLHVVSLASREPEAFDLPGKPLRRPTVRSGEVFGLCEGSAYFYRPGDPDLTRVPFQDTPLEGFTGEDHAEKTGDPIVASAGNRIVACELNGRLRWRFPVDGSVTTGSGGEICVCSKGVQRSSGSIHGIAGEDGRAIWSTYWPGHRDRVRGKAILGGRLVIFSEKMLSVFDAATGQLLMNLPQERKLVRGHYHVLSVLLRMALAGDVLVVGFEKWVYGVDLTPTETVPAADQKADPANALSELDALSKLSGSRFKQVRKLAEIGCNMADTPQAAADVLPLVRDLILSEGGSPEYAIMRAFHWLRDPAVLNAMERYVENEKNAYLGRNTVLEMIAYHPDSARALPILRRVLRSPNRYSSGIRTVAARRLRLLGEEPEIPPADLKLLYGGDQIGVVAEFRARLQAADAQARAQVLRMLKLAPDAVVVALSEELSSLPDGEERALGTELLREAVERLDAIGRFQPR